MELIQPCIDVVKVYGRLHKDKICMCLSSLTDLRMDGWNIPTFSFCKFDDTRNYLISNGESRIILHYNRDYYYIIAFDDSDSIHIVLNTLKNNGFNIEPPNIIVS